MGIVSRGYGGTSTYPLEVMPDTSFRLAGDEAVLLARRTKCPVIVDPNRTHAVQRLIERHPIDIVLSDDGLQHYELARNLEVSVLDGTRRLGNGMLLPSGPLREPNHRLKDMDWIVANGCKTGLFKNEWVMDYCVTSLVNVDNATRISVSKFQEHYGKHITAVAGIGNPKRFEQTLLNEGFSLDFKVFRDHHVFSEGDFSIESNDVIVVTEKDAQKIRELPTVSARVWYVEIEAQFEKDLDDFLTAMFDRCGLSMDRNL